MVFCCMFHKHENLYVSDQGHLCCVTLWSVSELPVEAGALSHSVSSPGSRDQTCILLQLWFGTAHSIVLYISCLSSQTILFSFLYSPPTPPTSPRQPGVWIYDIAHP